MAPIRGKIGRLRTRTGTGRTTRRTSRPRRTHPLPRLPQHRTVPHRTSSRALERHCTSGARLELGRLPQHRTVPYKIRGAVLQPVGGGQFDFVCPSARTMRRTPHAGPTATVRVGELAKSISINFGNDPPPTPFVSVTALSRAAHVLGAPGGARRGVAARAAVRRVVAHGGALLARAELARRAVAAPVRVDRRVPAVALLPVVLVPKKSGNIFRVGMFLDFVWLTTRTMHPHGAYVRGARRNRIDPHGGVIERLATRTTPPLPQCGTEASSAGLSTEDSGRIFRVGILLHLVGSPARTMHPRGAGAYVRVGGRSRIDPHQARIERPAGRTAGIACPCRSRCARRGGPSRGGRGCRRGW